MHFDFNSLENPIFVRYPKKSPFSKSHPFKSLIRPSKTVTISVVLLFYKIIPIIFLCITDELNNN